MVWSRRGGVHAGLGQPRVGRPAATTCATTRAASPCPTPQPSPGAPDARAAAARTGTGSTTARVRFIVYPEPYATADLARLGGERRRRCSRRPRPIRTLRFIVTAGHRPAYSSGTPRRRAAARARSSTASASGFAKYVLNLAGHTHAYERTQTAGARRPRHRRHRRRRAGARRDRLQLARLQGARFRPSAPSTTASSS